MINKTNIFYLAVYKLMTEKTQNIFYWVVNKLITNKMQNILIQLLKILASWNIPEKTD